MASGPSIRDRSVDPDPSDVPRRGHLQRSGSPARRMDTRACRGRSSFPSEVCLSPNAGGEPPSDPRGVIRIARKLYLKNSILRDSAIEQKRQAEDHNERGREPRSERGSACRYDQNPGGVSGMTGRRILW